MSSFAEKNWGKLYHVVAYSLNFVQMCYGYDSDSSKDYYKSLCPHCEDYSIQFRDFEYPKGGFSKKDYYILDTCDYGVSDRLKEDLLEFGVPEMDFRPIYTRNHDSILGWQITPHHILPSTYQVNGMEKKCCCPICDLYKYEYKDEFSPLKYYDGIGNPDFINDEALNCLNKYSIALTEDKHSVYISSDLYEHLLKKYPRIECRPVILGDINHFIVNNKKHE